MSEAIVVAIISGLFTAGGAIVSVMTANRVTAYKIEVIQKEMAELKDETKKHNQIIERTYKLEERCSVIETDVKIAKERLSDLEKEGKA